MGRLLAIDYGLKRIGLAATDSLKILASPVDTVDPKDIYQFLEEYLAKEEVDEIIVGFPLKLDGSETNNTQPVEKFVARIKKRFPSYPVVLHDERLTSKMALDAMIAAGTTKSDRRQKGNIDKLSAVIILESYLRHCIIIYHL